MGSVRPTQGRILAVAQVCLNYLHPDRRLTIAQVNGGSQSFNTVNTLRVLGRWMRMFVIPNQGSCTSSDPPIQRYICLIGCLIGLTRFRLLFPWHGKLSLPAVVSCHRRIGIDWLMSARSWSRLQQSFGHISSCLATDTVNGWNEPPEVGYILKLKRRRRRRRCLLQKMARLHHHPRSLQHAIRCHSC